MVHDLDQPVVDDSIPQIPDGMFASEAYSEYAGEDDDEPAEASGSDAELDEDHLEKNFEYEMDPHSESDMYHGLYDDDGLPPVDGDNSPLTPWQDGIVYTEGQYNYLTSFVSAYREARTALQHTKTGRDYKVVGRFKSSKSGFKQKKPYSSFKKFTVTKKPYTKNKKPKSFNKGVKTAAKQYVNGGSGRKDNKSILKHVKC